MDNENRSGTNTANGSRDYHVIDIVHVLKALWIRAWIIVLAGIIAAGAGFSYAAFVLTPKYSSSVMLYVNNSSFSLGNTNFSISSSEILAAQSLVKTYSVILKNRTTLDMVNDEMKRKHGYEYEYKELHDMITASAVNETEIMRVTVVSDNPEEAAAIANCIAEVLPVRISEIIEGSSMEVVDRAVANYQKISPSITKYTAIGLMLGVLLSVAVLTVIAMMDGTIHDEEYVLNTYDYPVLAKIPDLVGTGSKRYGYGYKRYGYYYRKYGAYSNYGTYGNNAHAADNADKSDKGKKGGQA